MAHRRPDGSPLAAFHSRAVSSSSRSDIRLSSALNCAPLTSSHGASAPRSVRRWPRPTAARCHPLQVKIRLSSALNCAPWTRPSWRIGAPIGSPLAASHSRAVPSSLQVRIRLSSALNCAPLTRPHGASAPRSVRRWPRSTAARCRRRSRSESGCSSALNCAPLTVFSWRIGAPIGSPLAASHRRAVPSSLQVKIRLSSALNCVAPDSVPHGASAPRSVRRWLRPTGARCHPRSRSESGSHRH